MILISKWIFDVKSVVRRTDTEYYCDKRRSSNQ